MMTAEDSIQARSERAEARARLKVHVWNALAPIAHPETRETAYDALAAEVECGTFHSRWFQVGHYIVGVLDDELTPVIAVEELSPFQRRSRACCAWHGSVRMASSSSLSPRIDPSSDSKRGLLPPSSFLRLLHVSPAGVGPGLQFVGSVGFSPKERSSLIRKSPLGGAS